MNHACVAGCLKTESEMSARSRPSFILPWKVLEEGESEGAAVVANSFGPTNRNQALTLISGTFAGRP